MSESDTQRYLRALPVKDGGNADLAAVQRTSYTSTMARKDYSPVEVVRQFNDCITKRDASSLSSLLTEDHVFIDSAGNSVTGRQSCIAAWRGFFDAFPDYYNVLDRMEVKEDFVAIVGHSVCSDARLHGPALWKAVVVNERLAEWHVLDDTEENKRLLLLGS